MPKSVDHSLVILLLIVVVLGSSLLAPYYVLWLLVTVSATALLFTFTYLHIRPHLLDMKRRLAEDESRRR